MLCRFHRLIDARSWIQLTVLVMLVCGTLVWPLLGWYVAQLLLRVCRRLQSDVCSSQAASSFEARLLYVHRSISLGSHVSAFLFWGFSAEQP